MKAVEVVGGSASHVIGSAIHVTCCISYTVIDSLPGLRLLR